MLQEVQDLRETEKRLALARTIAREAGALALSFFNDRANLAVETKANPQDVVSEADKASERLLRERIRAAFPTDGLLGEEYGLDAGSSGFCWVMDPVDGTSPFVFGLPSWCVSVAVTRGSETVVGVIYAPVRDELFAASLGSGAMLNDKSINLTAERSLVDGLLGIGANHRVPPEAITGFLNALLHEGGLFIRNGSGALMLAYVAAGRLVAYYEPHMNAWDCLAGLCIIREAGGRIEDFLAMQDVSQGGRVVAAAPGAWDGLMRLIDQTDHTLRLDTGPAVA
jgi:myo-inositol-1(or 4)-monophosphatase